MTRRDLPVAARWPRAFARIAVALLVFESGLAAQAEQGALSRARDAAGAKRVGEALRHYDAWLTAHPTDAAVLREAAEVARRERRLFEAARWLERLVALDPAKPSAWYDLAATRMNQCRYELAIPALQQLASLESTDASLAARAEHRFLHSEAARRLEQWRAALDELLVATARAPDRREYQRSLAETYQNAGRFEEAAAEFAKLVRVEPSGESYYGLGVAQGELGNLDEALKSLREARRLKPKDPRTLLKLGLYATRKKDLLHAESYLIEARDVVPKNVEILFALAQVYRLQGRVEEMSEVRAEAQVVKVEVDQAAERERVFRREVANRPENLEAHVTFGLDLISQGRLDEAQVIFQRVLSFAPLHEIAILNLASLHARAGNGAAALQEIGKLIEADPAHEIANFHAGTILWSLRDYGGAVRYLNAALIRGMGNAKIHEALAACHHALGDPEAAVRHAQRAKELAAAAPETRTAR